MVELPPEQKREHVLRARLLAADVLALAAGNISAAMDHFATCLLGGLAATLALILGNLDRISPFIQITSIRSSAIIFLGALITGVIEKFLASVVLMGARGFAASKKLAEGNAEFDLHTYMSEAKRGFFWPWRWIMACQFRKLMRGDLVAGARMLFKMAQIQTFIALIESLFVFFAVRALVHGVHVIS